MWGWGCLLPTRVGHCELILFLTFMMQYTKPTRTVDASTILGFSFLGAATIRVTTLKKHLTKKIIKIFFIHFDMINKCPLQYISVKLLLMAPLYVWKVEIFQCGLYLCAGSKRARTVLDFNQVWIKFVYCWQDPKLGWTRNFDESVNDNSSTWVYPAGIPAIIQFPLVSGMIPMYWM